MNPDDFKDRFKKFRDAFGFFTDKYEEANPEWMKVALLQILYQAVENLKRAIEDPEEKEITWEAPFTELRYPAQADWEKVEPQYFHVTAEDLEDPERLKETFYKGFMTVKEVYVLRQVTREILVILKGGKGFYKVPLSLDKKLAKLPKKERARRIERILKPITKVSRLGPLYDIPLAGKRRAKAYLVIQLNPCVLDVDAKEAYYPIVIGLEFRGIRPEDIDAEIRAEFWKALLQGAEEAIPKENLAFLKRPGTEPTARPVTKEAPPVKVGLSLELQKFGHRPKQLGLFDSLLDDMRKEITEKSIDVIGLDISQAQNQALFAIQKLLNDTNYLGNIPGKNIESQGFSFKGFLPALQFTPAQYLEAFGLKKKKTARGWEEYSGEERRQALQALADLTKPYLFVYKQTYYKETGKGKREPVIDRIEKISPLILITKGWEALTKKEDAGIDKGTPTEATDEKLKAIAIEPAPIVVKGIDKFFLLKPANYAEEIKFLCPHASKFVYRFVDWLIAQAELKRRKGRPLVIEENFEEIAYHLRMDAYIKSNQGKRIRQIINKCYQAAKDLGYLKSYGTVRGQTKDLERLELKPEKFSRVKEIKEERERLDDTRPAH